MTYEELMVMLRNPGENGLPENIADQVAEVFDHETSIRDAKITEVEDVYSTAAAELASVKAHNYDLIRKIPAPGANDAKPTGDDTDNGPASFEDLFTTD